jgi:hypothetical protein
MFIHVTRACASVLIGTKAQTAFNAVLLTDIVLHYQSGCSLTAHELAER